MTRPNGSLIALALLSAACFAGCAQFLPVKNDPTSPDRSFRAPRSVAGFSTSTIEDKPQIIRPAKKIKQIPIEPNNVPPLIETLPKPPGTENKQVVQGPEKLPGDYLPPPKMPTEGSPDKAGLPPPPKSEDIRQTSQTGGSPPTPPSQSGGSPTPPSDNREALVQALQYLLENRHEEALTVLKKYDVDTQELFLRALPMLAMLTQKKVADMTPGEVATLHDQLQTLVSTLRTRTELVVEKMCFCESVTSFGNYRPLAPDHVFLASAPNRPGERVQLYVEVKNFASEKRDGFYESRFASSVEIRDSKDEKIWFHRYDDRQFPIRSRTFLNDYFNNYTFCVPHLPPGTYKLTVRIADETISDRHRQAEKSVELRIGSVLR